MISSSMKTTIDVKKQTRTFYARANLLLRNFRHCTDMVKCHLFQSYCTSMYCRRCTVERAQEKRARKKGHRKMGTGNRGTSEKLG